MPVLSYRHGVTPSKQLASYISIFSFCMYHVDVRTAIEGIRTGSLQIVHPPFWHSLLLLPCLPVLPRASTPTSAYFSTFFLFMVSCFLSSISRNQYSRYFFSSRIFYADLYIIMSVSYQLIIKKHSMVYICMYIDLL